METRTPPLPTPVYSTPRQFVPNSWEARRGHREFGFTIGAGVLVVALVAACVAFVQGHDPLGPSEWDPRVLPIVEFVEKERGYSFHHPVFVEFLTAEAYRAKATKGSLNPDNRAYYDLQARFFRSLGLIGGDVDLAAEQEEISDSGTLAYYSPSDRTVYVRGTELTASLRVTLAHELTHALQDQIFNLDFSRTKSDGEAFALRALAEGDAIRVENAYNDSLSEAERTQISDQSAADVGSSKALNSDNAPILLALFGAPYDLGVPFVRLLASIDGALDRAFRVPPTSEENVFDPASFLLHDRPLGVAAPKSPTNATHIADMGNEVGVVLWYLLIASHTDQKTALTAVEGWAGDAMTVYKQDDVVCTSLVFLGDTVRDGDEMQAALTQVIASLADHTPKLGRQGEDVTLTMCDPGPSATAPKIDASSIFAVPTVRSLLLGNVLSDPSLSPRQAECIVDKTLGRLDVAQILQILQAPTADDPLVQQVLTDLVSFASGCH
jgi:hypothetical protein